MAEVVLGSFDAIESGARLGHCVSEALDESKGCCPAMRRKGYYLFYMLLLLVDIISDSEVVQFSPEER